MSPAALRALADVLERDPVRGARSYTIAAVMAGAGGPVVRLAMWLDAGRRAWHAEGAAAPRKRAKWERDLEALGAA